MEGRELDPLELGATLYVPATRLDLLDIASGHRFPQLRSAVICLEDGIRPADAPIAMAQVRALLTRLGDCSPERRPALFLRPRDPDMLARLCDMPGLEHVAGFVLPKLTAARLPLYLARAGGCHPALMPTLETREVFDAGELAELRAQFLAVADRILAIRIGGNDLLHVIGARRSAIRTAYDGPLGPTIANLVTTFAPDGFALSAPVFEHFDQPATLREEVGRDIEHGLVTKTAIHPAQIEVIEDCYRVGGEDLAEARAVLATDAEGVFALAGSMCEPATHRRWAEALVKRAAIYGVRPHSVAAVS